MAANVRLWFSIFFYFSVPSRLVFAELRYPIVLIPGDGGSQIEARLDKPDVVHYICSKKSDVWFDLWLNLELLVPLVIDCWVDNMRLYYDNVSRTTSNSPGVHTRIPGFGDSSTVEWLDPSHVSPSSYFASVAASLLPDGYERNVSLRGAPYDFRKAPNENAEFFVNLKALIEETYTLNGNKKIVLVSHSMGSPMSLYFLNHQTQAWKDQYIRALVSLAGVWGGTVKALKVYAQGDDLGVRVLSERVLREEQRTSPSLAWLMPTDKFWDPNEIVVTTTTRNYTVHDFADFFNDINYPSGYEMWKDTRYLTHELEAPGVEVHCLHGSGVPTVEKLIYATSMPDGKALLATGDGDGTVNMRSLQGCLRWQGQQQQMLYHQEFPGRDHMAVLTDPEIIAYIRSVVTKT